MMGIVLTIIIFFVVGYLCGSVPFGLLLTRAAGLGDIRSIGSGNIGATNVLRTGNKSIAALTLLCDAFKGLIPVLLVSFWFPMPAVLATAAGAMAGHLFPVWLNFQGGKGVATFVGVLFGLDWRIGVIFALVWLTIAFLSRLSSLAALVAAALSPLAAYFLGNQVLIVPLALLAAVVWYRHSANISRLLKGEESKISFSKSK